MSHATVPTALPQAETAFAAAGLSSREKDAARSVLAGMTAEQASALMGVDASTVASYRQRAYAKLGLDNAQELTERYGTPGEKDQRAAVPTETYKRLRAHGLNETQARVLALVAEGLTTSEIAEALTIARGTVNSARANGYRLLHIHSREELAELLATPDAQQEPDIEKPEEPAAVPQKARWRSAVIALVAVVLVGVATLAVRDTFRADTPEAANDQAESEPDENQATYPFGLRPDGSFDERYMSFTAVTDDGTILFGLNEHGQFFGNETFSVEYLGGRLDLIACLGENGEKGYCYYSEVAQGYLEGEEPERILYEQDGTTRIGTLRYIDSQLDGQPMLEVPFTAYNLKGGTLFGLNKNGQYFGSRGFANLYLRGKLDLESALGQRGKTGYLLVSDMNRADHDKTITEIPVYEKNGETVIDTFELSYG